MEWLACLGVLFVQAAAPNDIQVDIQDWQSQLLRYPTAYPVRFAVAAGLLLVVVGLLSYQLATKGTRKVAAQRPMQEESSARGWHGILVSSLCLAGIVLGVLFARLTQSAETVNTQRQESSTTAADLVEVWVDPPTGRYFCQGTKRYGKTKTGRYLTQKEARSLHFRPALDKPCE